MSGSEECHFPCRVAPFIHIMQYAEISPLPPTLHLSSSLIVSRFLTILLQPVFLLASSAATRKTQVSSAACPRPVRVLYSRTPVLPYPRTPVPPYSRTPALPDCTPPRALRAAACTGFTDAPNMQCIMHIVNVQWITYPGIYSLWG